MHRRLPPMRIEPLVRRAAGHIRRPARGRAPPADGAPAEAAGAGGAGARSSGRGAGRTGRTLAGSFSGSSSSRRPRPTAASRCSRPPCGASPDARSPSPSPRLARSSFCAGIGSSSMRGMRGGAAGGPLRRRRDEGCAAPAASAASAGSVSGNSDGFGCIGRMVTSSMAVIGSTAAATAALAAVSIASGVGGGMCTGCAARATPA